MSTKNVTLKEKVNGALGDTIFPATTTPNVYDSAKSQALSQTLVNTPDYEALGFAKFSTATAYNTGDKVYKDNELYRFIADKTAGEWDVAKVEPWSVEQEIEEVDDAIRSLIPAQASADNKLADKAYVNDKVSTDTATFRGTFNLVTDLELTTEATQGQIATALGTAISGEDKNDYAFVQIPTSDATPTEIARIDRYKYTGLQWAFEYSLNNSGFTAEQWAAINSGITTALVEKLTALPTKDSLQEALNAKANAEDVEEFKQDVEATYAHKDGYYGQMGVGVADNLAGRGTVPAEYTFRTSGGTADLGTGSASIEKLMGKTLVWNQLVDTATTEVTTVSGRKYLTVIDGTSSIVTSDGTAIAVTGGTDNVYDLTLMFGAGNEPSTVAEFEALYPLDYYAYNAGTLINVTSSGIKTTGFNQWDEDWENGAYQDGTGIPLDDDTSKLRIRSNKNKPISVFQGQNYYVKSPAVGYFNAIWYDVNDNFIITTYIPSGTGILVPPTGAHYLRFYLSANYGTVYNHDICINLSWSGYRNGEYDPYEEHILYFNGENGSLSTVTGKLNGEGSSVTIFPDGMKSAGTYHDEYNGYVNGYLTKATKRMFTADLSELEWTLISEGSNNKAYAADLPVGKGYLVDAGICDTLMYRGKSARQYIIDNGADYYAANTLFTYITSGDRTIYAIVPAATASIVGNFCYPLATPEDYTLDEPIPANYYVNDFGTEQKLPADTASVVAAPILYNVQYAMNAVDTLRRLPLNYINTASMENFTTELASKLGTFLNATITVTPTYDSEHEEYDYSITIVANE